MNDTSNNGQHQECAVGHHECRFSKAIVLICGLLSYAIFFGSFVYAIGFVGNLVVPKSIDSGVEVSLAEAIMVNSLLLGFFAVQHSVMARPAFKRWWIQFVPSYVERSTYVLATSLLLFLMFWQWRPIPEVVWNADDPIRALLWGMFAIGWLLVLVSTFMIDHFDLFGLRQVYLYCKGRRYTPPPFQVTYLYRFVRHPIMLGFIIAFWFTPRMSWGHLLFAVMTTCYIFVGIYLEERDLRCAVGDNYEVYRRQVSMVLPRFGKSARSPANLD